MDHSADLHDAERVGVAVSRARSISIRLSVASAAVAATLVARAAKSDPPSWLARPVVEAATRRAVARAGLDTGIAQDLTHRAHVSALLPDLSFRVLHGMGAIAADVYQTPVRDSTSDSWAVDVRVHFPLERLIFHPSEVAIERAELRRADRRDALIREVIELLAVLERDLQTPPPADPTTPEAIARALQAATARARLESLIGAPIDSLTRP
jgi:hypothetical protein